MKRLTPQRLRKIIREELHGLKRVAITPSLVSVLFEDVTDDIAKASKQGPGEVRKLVNTYDDKDALKSALQGDYDQVEPDDVTGVGSAQSVDAGGFKPTQNEIDLMKSVAFPLGGASALKSMIVTNTTGAPGSITVAGDEVIDGHHRWSGVWGILGKKGKISVQDVALPGETKEKLAAAQLAIAAYKPADLEQPASAEPIPYNILGKKKAVIKKMMLDNVGKQTDKKAPGPLLNDEMLASSAKDKDIAAWAGFEVGAGVDVVLDKITDKVAANLAGIPSNASAPARADMPQFDNDAIGGKQAKADIYTGLKAGEYNVKPPFEEQGDDDEEPGDDEIAERWSRLAGLLKG